MSIIRCTLLIIKDKWPHIISPIASRSVISFLLVHVKHFIPWVIVLFILTLLKCSTFWVSILFHDVLHSISQPVDINCSCDNTVFVSFCHCNYVFQSSYYIFSIRTCRENHLSNSLGLYLRHLLLQLKTKASLSKMNVNGCVICWLSVRLKQKLC